MRIYVALACVACLAVGAGAQGVLSDIMSGSLVNPEVGVYAWYELKDTETGLKLFMRQAIVGEKRVNGKTGYYLETEVVPEVGFPVIYKMLLTGPATDMSNVHEIVVKEGPEPPETLPLDVLHVEEGALPEPVRTLQGREQVVTPTGDVDSEHFIITEGELKTEVWVNDTIRPMGIVKMVSPDGELLLTRHGKGGVDAESAIDRFAADEKAPDVKVRVETGPRTNFTGRGMQKNE